MAPLLAMFLFWVLFFLKKDYCFYSDDSSFQRQVLPYDALMQELDVNNVRELEDFLINECMYVVSQPFIFPQAILLPSISKWLHFALSFGHFFNLVFIKLGLYSVRYSWTPYVLIFLLFASVV